jgi:phospholipid/cholesterol/gamma-HCH transport system ATP-binding protein
MSSAISIETVTKTFNNQIALKSLTLDIPSGTSIALIGPAASGKSVLMKCILGLMAIDSGVIRIHGELNSRRSTPPPTCLGTTSGRLYTASRHRCWRRT